MPIDTRFRLSTLQPLDWYLAQSITIDSGLLEALEEVLPPKELDKVAKLLDKLLEHPLGTKVLVLTLRFLLAEWLKEGEDRLGRVNQGLAPFEWLATSDHLEVVHTFQQLL